MQKKKTKIVTIRMTPKVKTQLQQRAQDANMGRITVLRGDELISEYTKLCDVLGTLVREVR